ncbi:MAG: hypothetical protein ABID61_00060 [Candidatus Micrarchaeota archaeon]
MPRLETEEEQTQKRTNVTSYFDINQLELAIINRALQNQLKRDVPEYVSIGKNTRILTIQKRNLERLCRKMGRECRDRPLETELKKILSGSKVFSLICFSNRYEE